MVKLGFIVEGETEKILLESEIFKDLLSKFKLDYISEIVDAGGNGNLLPKNIEKISAILIDKGASKIIVLTDLDKDKCVTETKNRISPLENHICVISKKEIEAWFLADTLALSNFLKSSNFDIHSPETIEEPFEEIKKLRMNLNNRGIGDKKILARFMVKNNFSFERAASHPNCTSAKYFIDKLKTLSNQN
jgi:hypothetical protein